MDKTFSKLEKGSIRGSIMALCSAAVGGGVLSLPFVFVLSGYVAGIALILIGGLAGVLSNLLIARAAIEHNIMNLDQLALKSGGKCLQNSLQVIILIYVFGACIGYIIITTELV